MATANGQLTGALGRLRSNLGLIPEFKADQGFLRLQDELTGTENRIATSRNDYNQAVQAYNTYIRTFPQAITAKVTGAKPRTYFEAAAGTGGAANCRLWDAADPGDDDASASKEAVKVQIEHRKRRLLAGVLLSVSAGLRRQLPPAGIVHP